MAKEDSGSDRYVSRDRARGGSGDRPSRGRWDESRGRRDERRDRSFVDRGADRSSEDRRNRPESSRDDRGGRDVRGSRPTRRDDRGGRDDRRQGDRPWRPRRDDERGPRTFGEERGARAPREERRPGNGDRPRGDRSGGYGSSRRQDGPANRRRDDRPGRREDGRPSGPWDERRPTDRRDERRPADRRDDRRPADRRDDRRTTWGREDRPRGAEARRPDRGRDGRDREDRRGEDRRGGERQWQQRRPAAERHRDDPRHRSGRSFARDVERRGRRDDREARPGQERRAQRGPEPEVPEWITGTELDDSYRQELRALSKDTAHRVSRHLVAALVSAEEAPEDAIAHARFAVSIGARVGIVRETYGVIAYQAGDYHTAVRELRTALRITGRADMLPMLADAERGLGRPERALDIAASPEAEQLGLEATIELMIVVAGAYADTGDVQTALASLEIPALRQKVEGRWQVRLWVAYADLLEKAGRSEEARKWLVLAADADTERITDAAERLGRPAPPVDPDPVWYDAEEMPVIDAFDEDADEEDADGEAPADASGEPIEESRAETTEHEPEVAEQPDEPTEQQTEPAQPAEALPGTDVPAEAEEARS